MDTESQIRQLKRVSNSVLAMLHSGALLTGAQENTLVDTIRDLGLGYAEWLKRIPQKEQSYPPDETK